MNETQRSNLEAHRNRVANLAADLADNRAMYRSRGRMAAITRISIALSAARKALAAEEGRLDALDAEERRNREADRQAAMRAFHVGRGHPGWD